MMRMNQANGYRKWADAATSGRWGGTRAAAVSLKAKPARLFRKLESDQISVADRTTFNSTVKGQISPKSPAVAKRFPIYLSQTTRFLGMIEVI
jgi:hypothetical protein